MVWVRVWTRVWVRVRTLELEYWLWHGLGLVYG